jgi:glucokinase
MGSSGVLAGDIGGTHARLAVVRWTAEGRPEIQVRREYASEDYDSLESIVREFLDDLHAPPGRACLAVPCPTLEEMCRPANLPWSIQTAGFDEAIGVPGAILINDFDAVGHAIAHLTIDGVALIRSGEAREGAPVAVLGAGTGLGVVFVLPGEQGPRIVPSEGGHLGFSPRDSLGWELRSFLAERHGDESGGHVSYERVLSGEGLADLYRFLIDSGRERERPETRSAMCERDPAAVVTDLGLAGSDPACVRALEKFASIYGAFAGDLALLVRARGGVYLGGGIAPRILPALRAASFERAFLDKGRLRTLVEPVPAWVITNRDAGLIGAAAVARGVDTNLADSGRENRR